MKNRTDFIDVPLMDKLRQGSKNYGYVLQSIGMVALGYITANSYILNGISPFGIALAAASSGNLWMTTTLGVLLGYIFSINVNLTMKYIAATLLIAGIKWLMDGKKMDKYHQITGPLLAWLSLTTTSLMVAYAYGFATYDIIIAFAEGLLAGGATYFFVRSVWVFKMGQSLLSLKHTDSSCVIVALCTMITAVTSLQLIGISVGRVVAVLVVLICAYMGHEGGGTIAGVACGTAVIIASTGNSYLLGAYALGGMLAGLFSPLGRIGCAAAFLLVNGLVAVLVGEPSRMMGEMSEALIAAVGFLLIPKGGMQAIRVYAFRQMDRTKDRGLKTLLISRLEDTSYALGDIADTTKQVAKKLGKMASGNLGEVYYQAADKVCRKCGHKTRCWQEGYNDTMACLNALTTSLKKTGTISMDDFTEPLAGRCIYKDKLAANVSAGYRDYTTRESTHRKLSQIRSVVTDQFEGMSQLLDGIVMQLASITGFDNSVTAKVKDYLEKLGAEPLDVVCYKDDGGRLFIRIKLLSVKVPRLDAAKVAVDLSQLCERDFALPVSEAQENTTALLFCEKTELTVKVATAQHNCHDGKMCGDSYAVFTDKVGCAHLLLSDGMGSGSSAALDSTMTVSLIRKLVAAGVDYDAALKLVNSALLVKSGEESLSTVDVSAIDLYTGKVTFYKAGAAPTFIKKYGKAGYVESTSMPVGILTSAAFEKSSTSLKQGDVLLMVSDGVTASGIEWIQSALEHFEGDDLQSLCDDIVKTAKLKRSDSHDDDITAVAALLKKAS